MRVPSLHRFGHGTLRHYQRVIGKCLHRQAGNPGHLLHMWLENVQNWEELAALKIEQTERLDVLVGMHSFFVEKKRQGG